MTSLGIFLYGIVVFSLVGSALGLLAWGIVAERRDRLARARHPEEFDGRDATTFQLPGMERPEPR